MQSDINELIKMFEDRYALAVSIARRYAPMPDLTYDIVQQAFIHFIRNAEKNGCRNDKEITPLLHEITKNVAISFWRRESRHKNALLRSMEERLQAPLDPAEITEEKEHKRKLMEKLGDCLKKLSVRKRKFVERHYIDGISMEAMAKEMDAGANAVRQAFCRIRAELRNCIGENNDE